MPASMGALAITAVLAICCSSLVTAHPPSEREPGYAAWDTSDGACPCASPALCDPVTRTGPEDVYAFHTAGTANWRQYDWSQITTVSVFGALDPEMLCHAHASGARVTLAQDGPKQDQWHNATAVSEWAAASVATVQGAFADGFNLDVEVAVSNPSDAAALTALTQQAADAMHDAVPSSHVSFDTPSLGLLQDGPCGSQYGRMYDYTALAQAVDFFVVMDYDSNGSPGGACATCFYANSPMPVVKAGVQCYARLGVPASKLVLAFPWYGYTYTCAAGNTPQSGCNVIKKAQANYPDCIKRLPESLSGRQWNASSQSPFLWYDDDEGGLHRVDYDDVQSLTIKFQYAKSIGAAGVGMWQADSLDYGNATQIAQMWAAFKAFK